jgi:hypothetical protein
MKIIARDESGREFPKFLHFYTNDGGKLILSLGYPIEYEVTPEFLVELFTHSGGEFTIDIGGRLHFGHKVLVKVADLLLAVGKLFDEVRTLQPPPGTC